MRIKRFRAEKIYGRIDFDIRFNDNLNFLVGINGSGKTTILRSLSALISPSLISLAYLDYKLIEVEIRHKRKKIIITTTKNDNKLKMFNNQIKEELEVQMYPQDEPIYRQPRLEDRQLEYYREEENRMANHPVMQSIRSLPSPMLLGIERRSRELFAPEERPQDIGHFTGQRYVRRGYVRYRNIFGNTLYDSLTEAEELASVVFSDIQRRQFIATEELRRNILLSSFMYEEIETTTKYSFRDVYERAIDTEKQMLYDYIAATIHDDCPYVYLFQERFNYIISSEWTGMELRIGEQYFYPVHRKQAEPPIGAIPGYSPQILVVISVGILSILARNKIKKKNK